MAEGIFPKVDGDILYASEVNFFNGFGDGSNGVYSNSGNLLQGVVYQYSSFSLTNGNTLTTASTSGLPIFIYVQGDCTIGGTITLDGKGYDGGTGAGGGGTSNNGSDGTIGQSAVIHSTYGISGGSVGSKGIKLDVPHEGSGGGGGDSTSTGSTLAGTLNEFSLAHGAQGVHIDSGAGGGQGGGGAGDTASTGGNGGNGGNGGGSMVFIVGGNFTFSATGIITLDGNAGSNGTAGTGTAGGGGGGGGGGAGCLWVICKGTITNSGTITTTGGGAGSGGAGSGGWNSGSVGSVGSDGTNRLENVKVRVPRLVELGEL